MNITVELIGAAAIICIAIGITIYHFVKLSKEQKIANIKEWLKWAVTVAEKDLGSGTGQLKLRQVYNMAVAQFPWIIQVITFDTFKLWVDDALIWMRLQLENNNAVADFIKY